MNRRPMTFGELIGRLAPPLPADAIPMGPIIATAIELDADGTPAGRQMWSVVHSVTDAELRLIHPEMFCSARVAVQINARAGEVLRVILEVGVSRQHGDLFDTCARFVQSGRAVLSASA